MSVISFEGKRPLFGKRVFIAPGCDVLGDVRIGDDASIWYRCVLRGDINHIEIGARSNVQDGTIIHVEHGAFPTILEEETSVGHAAILHGCILRRGCLVGMGATVLNGADIGEGALVAAGSVVREGFKVPAGTLVAGVPAVVRRRLKNEEILRVLETAAHYVEYKDRYFQEHLGEMEPLR